MGQALLVTLIEPLWLEHAELSIHAQQPPLPPHFDMGYTENPDAAFHDFEIGNPQLQPRELQKYPPFAEALLCSGRGNNDA